MNLLYIPDVKENYTKYGLPYDFVQCLPSYCPTCGAVMAMESSLTGLHCENPRCQDKLVMRIRAICNSLNILNFGEKAIEKFITYYGVTNPLNMFALRRGMLISDEVSEDVSYNITSQIEDKRHFLLWEYVQIANIPGVQTSSRLLFQGYKTLDEAYSDIETYGVVGIQKKLGIENNGEVSVRAMKIYKALIEFKEDLFESVGDVDIISIEGKKELNVVCSDQVGFGFSKKPEFYAYVNKHFADKVHINFLPSVNKSIDYLVWAGADGTPARYTSKVKTVEGYHAKGLNIPIVTAEQFIKLMEEL